MRLQSSLGPGLDVVVQVADALAALAHALTARVARLLKNRADYPSSGLKSTDAVCVRLPNRPTNHCLPDYWGGV